MTGKNKKKSFKSWDEIEAYYFPNTYANKKRDDKIKDAGFGKRLARELLDEVEKEMKKNKCLP